MAYFSNGSEGSDYEEKYCAGCCNGGQDNMCPVWHAHFLYAYASAGDPRREVLDLLIPMDGTFAGKCAMYITVEMRSQRRKKHRRQLQMFVGKSSP